MIYSINILMTEEDKDTLLEMITTAEEESLLVNGFTVRVDEKHDES
jgi:hypothetical protein|tara:strand:- start:886 stop:1023 length:138 start_codon:yes stop_codon:yes gene_type:complete